MNRTATTCYVCDAPGQHAPTPLHNYWSYADADAYFTGQDSRLKASIPSMTAVETLNPCEAVVA